MKQLTLNDFQNKLNEKYPQEQLIALTYTDMKSPARVKCKTCGKEIELKTAQNFFLSSKKRVCSTCFPNKRDQMSKSIDNFIEFLKHQDLFIMNDEASVRAQIKNSDSLVTLKCARCGKENRKTIYDYEAGKGCTCSCTNTLKTSEEFKKELPDDIELLDEYQGAFVNVMFRHKTCGFCWKAKPHNILNGKGCPKCNRKTSKGEQAIEKVLTNLNIGFIKEYPIEVEGHQLRLDFYLPKYNLGIEYNGIQHYEPIKHFGGEEKLKVQQEYDRLKNQYYNIITIPYWEIDCIEEKLSQVFNDYPGREQG